MLLRIFKTSQPLSWFLIVLIIIVLRLGLFYAFFSSVHVSEIKHFTPQYLLDFNTDYTWISHVLSTIIVVFSSFYFNQITQKLNILSGINYLMLLFTGIFLSYEPQMLVLSPVILATPLLLISFPILIINKKEELALDTLFNSMFIIGLTSLLYFPSILLSFAILISFLYLVKVTWRHFIIGIIGWVTPWVFHDVFQFSFLSNAQLKLPIWTNNWQLFQISNYQPRIAIAALLITLFMQSTVYYSVATRSVIRVRKALQINFWYLLIGLFSVGILVEGNQNLVGLIVLPLAIFFAVFHFEAKKWWVSDTLFLALLGSLLLNYMGL